LANVLKFLLPYQRWTIRSALSPEAAAEALASEVQALRLSTRTPPNRIFEGRVETHAFDIQRAVRSRNSGSLSIRGRIRADRHGSSISITISVPLPVAAVQSVCIALLVFSRSSKAHGRLGPDAMVALALMLVFTVGAFAFAAASAMRELRGIFGPSNLRSS